MREFYRTIETLIECRGIGESESVLSGTEFVFRSGAVCLYDDLKRTGIWVLAGVMGCGSGVWEDCVRRAAGEVY